MSGDLVPIRAAQHLSAREQRALYREVAAMLARTRADAVIEAERVAAIGYVAQRAMDEAAFLAQHHIGLIALVPLADGACQVIRDAATLVMVRVVQDMGR